jgi:hypothetical protein
MLDRLDTRDCSRPPWQACATESSWFLHVQLREEVSHEVIPVPSNWQAHLLNTMGRAVLVNSVMDSQLVYFMSSLHLPPTVIKQMDGKRRAFLWSGDKTGKASPDPSKLLGCLDQSLQPQRTGRPRHEGHWHSEHLPSTKTTAQVALPTRISVVHLG